jgi:hypothetical protein
VTSRPGESGTGFGIDTRVSTLMDLHTMPAAGKHTTPDGGQ